jgi:hypothetical protein
VKLQHAAISYAAAQGQESETTISCCEKHQKRLPVAAFWQRSGTHLEGAVAVGLQVYCDFLGCSQSLSCTPEQPEASHTYSGQSVSRAVQSQQRPQTKQCVWNVQQAIKPAPIWMYGWRAGRPAHQRHAGQARCR